jgi:hypothetical protein
VFVIYRKYVSLLTEQTRILVIEVVKAVVSDWFHLHPVPEVTGLDRSTKEMGVLEQPEGVDSLWSLL